MKLAVYPNPFKFYTLQRKVFRCSAPLEVEMQTWVRSPFHDSYLTYAFTYIHHRTTRPSLPPSLPLAPSRQMRAIENALSSPPPSPRRKHSTEQIAEIKSMSGMKRKCKWDDHFLSLPLFLHDLPPINVGLTLQSSASQDQGGAEEEEEDTEVIKEGYLRRKEGNLIQATSKRLLFHYLLFYSPVPSPLPLLLSFPPLHFAPLHRPLFCF